MDTGLTSAEKLLQSTAPLRSAKIPGQVDDQSAWSVALATSILLALPVTLGVRRARSLVLGPHRALGNLSLGARLRETFPSFFLWAWEPRVLLFLPVLLVLGILCHLSRALFCFGDLTGAGAGAGVGAALVPVSVVAVTPLPAPCVPYTHEPGVTSRANCGPPQQTATGGRSGSKIRLGSGTRGTFHPPLRCGVRGSGAPAFSLEEQP